jgi:Bacterial SH3 domain
MVTAWYSIQENFLPPKELRHETDFACDLPACSFPACLGYLRPSREWRTLSRHGSDRDPLNARTGPNGTVLGTLSNGVLVSIIEQTYDERGRPWVYVAGYQTGQPIGWVYREYIACF